MVKTDGGRVTRREMVGGLASLIAFAGEMSGEGASGLGGRPMRLINVMNFIRAEEPREAIDLMEPVRGQMELIKRHGLPATWLLQYDALEEGPFAEYLKAEMPADHEAGIWLEMNRRLCDAAGIPWRGKAAWEWDYHVPVAYAIGYPPDERRRLADAAMAGFKRRFGTAAKSVASWNLDAVTLAHLADHHGVDAFGNCRDQLATDGFTIWGAPIAAYYPSRKNAWSPALERANQIPTPMFRLLGQDPVYYYDKVLPYPDTMEPAWPSGQSSVFVDAFLTMMEKGPTQSVAYAQLGQENSFGWPVMREAYRMQMERLAGVRTAGRVTVETMGESGRRFKRAFATTPTQAQVMLSDPFGKEPAQRTIWYQSRYYRANLHFVGGEFFLRDLHVYSDEFAQPYLVETVEQHGIEQRMLAALDGYHWSDDAVRAGREGRRARGRFVRVQAGGKETTLRMEGVPEIVETGRELNVRTRLAGGGWLRVDFRERAVTFTLGDAAGGSRLGLVLEWAAGRSALRAVEADRLQYRFRDFDYAVRVREGVALQRGDGVGVVARRRAIRLEMTQGR